MPYIPFNAATEISVQYTSVLNG